MKDSNANHLATVPAVCFYVLLAFVALVPLVSMAWVTRR